MFDFDIKKTLGIAVAYQTANLYRTKNFGKKFPGQPRLAFVTARHLSVFIASNLLERLFPRRKKWKKIFCPR